jgi:hypothetical protein
MATKKNTTINDTDKVRVYKNMVGSISYRLRGIFVFWDEKTEYKDMYVTDIKEMLGQSDLYVMFDRNKLLIKDEKAREELRIRPLNENYLDSEKIKELLNSNNANKVEKVVESCEDNELDMMVEIAVKEKIKDRNVIGILEDYTGLDLADDILHSEDNNSENNAENPKPKRTKKK